MTSRDRIVIIAGASGDIGKCLTARAATMGFGHVLAVARSANFDMAPYGSGVEFIGGVDLTLEANVEALRARIEDLPPGRIILIHAVGNFWRHRPISALKIPEISAVVSSQVVTLFGSLRAVSDEMLRRGSGLVVGFSCNSVSYNYPEMAPFTASKAAVESALRCFSNENGCKGVGGIAIELPTLQTDKVLASKPTADFENYLAPAELSRIVLENIIALPHECTGSVLRVVKYNEAFYKTSYFERNPSGRTTP